MVFAMSLSNVAILEIVISLFLPEIAFSLYFTFFYMYMTFLYSTNNYMIIFY